MTLQLAHRLEGFVAGPVFGAAHHAAQQLVEHRQGCVGQVFLKADAGCRQRRMSAQGIEFAKMLGRSEEHTSELQSLMRISYAVFCLTKKNRCINNKCNTSNTYISIQYHIIKSEHS